MSHEDDEDLHFAASLWAEKPCQSSLALMALLEYSEYLPFL